MKQYVSLFLIALMFCVVVSTGCGGGSSNNDSGSTESISEETGEDTTYDPNEDGRGNTGGTSDTISFTLELNTMIYQFQEATLYGRKSLGNNQLSVWSPLVKIGYAGKISELLNGAQQEGTTFSIPGEFVEFGFEFDTEHLSWPYSGVFWTASQSQNEKVKSISVVVSGYLREFTFIANVNGRQIINQDCSYECSQHYWNKADNKIRVIVLKDTTLSNLRTSFYARKAGGKWEALLNDHQGKFYRTGSVSETLYIDESYVEFGFEFDVAGGYDWPYSGVFWTADQSRSEKVDAIYIYMSGVRYFPRINIYVNGNLIFSKESDSHGTQYNWD